MALEDIDHSKTKAKSPQTNGICERFHKTVQDEFYAIAFRKKLYTSLEQLQQDVDLWIDYYNQQRTHSGKYCFGKTPMQTFLESVPLAKEKLLEQLANPLFSPFVQVNAEQGTVAQISAQQFNWTRLKATTDS